MIDEEIITRIFRDSASRPKYEQYAASLSTWSMREVIEQYLKITNATSGSWKVGDWCIYGLGIVQITEIYPTGEGLVDTAVVSNGVIESRGLILSRCRPLTLVNKAAAEFFHTQYQELYKIDGEIAFNYPAISNHFELLLLAAIDAPNIQEAKRHYEAAQDFVLRAKARPVYTIQGVPLYRPGRS